jgi:retron-type reverse transcriptase
VRRYGDLWGPFLSWDNLLLAARKARRGKRDRPVVQRFEFRREAELLRLQRELEDGAWQPGPFATHWIRRPKPRLISAAPYRDRVVHHALLNVLGPILERHFHPHSYACRPGKGTHAAADRLQRLQKRYRFVLPCDVRKFFPSLDHALLKATFRRLLKDARLLAVMDRVVDGSNDQEPVQDWFPGDDLLAPARRRRGLPIGNLTSQWFANWYLNQLDHTITARWGFGGYVRYCDDFLLLHDDPGRLRAAIPALVRAAGALRLRLHEQRLGVRACAAGIPFVGFRNFPAYRLLKGKNVRRFARRLRWLRRACRARRLRLPEARAALISWLGHARQANTHRLLRSLSRRWWLLRQVCREFGPRAGGSVPLLTPAVPAPPAPAPPPSAAGPAPDTGR